MIFSWRVLGISDAAELFIFISGFLFGLIYYRTFLTQGYWACQRKALFRSMQIYLANLGTLIAVIALAWFFHRDHQKLLETSDLDPFFSHTARAIKSFMLLDDMPGVFDVLFLYVFFLAFMPVLMLIFHRRPALAVTLSLLAYAAAFKDPVMKLVGHFRLWAFALDPLAWQFLFFIGMILGMKKRTGSLHLTLRPGWVRLLVGFLALVFVLKMVTYGIDYNLFGLGSWQAAKPWLLPLSGKLKLEPMRLVHFFALVYLVALWVPAESPLLRTTLARLVINCGQHSLKIFCSSLILSYLVCLIFTRVRPGLLLQFAIIAGGWMMLLLIGRVLASLRRKPEAPPVLLPEPEPATQSSRELV